MRVLTKIKIKIKIDPLKSLKGGIDMMFGLSPVKNEMLNRGSAYGDFYNAIDNFFNDDFYLRPDLLAKGFRMDVKETGNAYIVEAELPGVKRDEIEINYHQDTLYIATHFKDARKQAESNEEKQTSKQNQEAKKSSECPEENVCGMNNGEAEGSNETSKLTSDVGTGQETQNKGNAEYEENTKVRYIHQERRHVSMQRGIYLPEIKKDAIEAKLDSGILTVIVPKQKASDEAFKIQIQ